MLQAGDGGWTLGNIFLSSSSRLGKENFQQPTLLLPDLESNLSHFREKNNALEEILKNFKGIEHGLEWEVSVVFFGIRNIMDFLKRKEFLGKIIHTEIMMLYQIFLFFLPFLVEILVFELPEKSKSFT